MKKLLVNLGIQLSKEDQKQIVGGFSSGTCLAVLEMQCLLDCTGVCVVCEQVGWKCKPKPKQPKEIA